MRILDSARTGSPARLRAASAAWLAVALLALGAAGCTASETSDRVTKLLGGADVVSVLRDEGEHVRREAWRLDPAVSSGADAPAAQGATDLHGFPIVAGPVPISAEHAAALADVLLQDGTYDWDRAKGCEFLPGLAIRETRGATVVDVLVCFSCDEIAVWKNGVKTGGEDVDSRRSDLIALARRIFPGDAKFRALR